jgi:hypothetical protein
LYDSLHIDAQSLQLLPNLGFRHTLANVFQQALASILRERKCVKTHTLAFIEAQKDADSGPDAVGTLRHQHQDLSFHLGHDLASGLRANPLRNLSVFFTPDMYTEVLLRRSPRGNDFPLGRWTK